MPDPITFLQHIDHTGEPALSSSEVTGGNVIVDTTTCCRGFWTRLQVWNAVAPAVLIHFYEGAIPDCGPTSAGTKVWSTDARKTYCASFTIQHTGSGTINTMTGAFTSTSGGGTATGDVTGAVAISLSGNVTNPVGPVYNYSGTISGAVTGTFTGSGTGSTGTSIYTITSPSGFEATGTFTMTFNVGLGTFSWFGTITGYKDPVDVYTEIEVSSCEPGGTVMTMFKAEDDSVLAVWDNRQYGWPMAGRNSELRLVSAVCANCEYRWFTGSAEWPKLLSIRMNNFGVPSGQGDENTITDFEISNDGTGLGALANGLSVAGIIGSSPEVQHVTGSGGTGTYTFDVLDRTWTSASIYERIYQVEITAPFNYRISYRGNRQNHGPCLGRVYIGITGPAGVCQIHKTRVSDSAIVTTVRNNCAFAAPYYAPGVNGCATIVLDRGREFFAAGYTTTGWSAAYASQFNLVQSAQVFPLTLTTTVTP